MSADNENGIRSLPKQALFIGFMNAIGTCLLYADCSHDLEKFLHEYHDYFNPEKFQVVVDALNALS